MSEFNRTEGSPEEFEEEIFEPLPAQTRATPLGRALLNLSDFAGRAPSATGFVLLLLAGIANLGTTLLVVLLHRSSPGAAVVGFIAVGLSWAFWLGLAFLRWRLKATGPGSTVGTTWGMEESGDAALFDSHPPAPKPGSFQQRATLPEEFIQAAEENAGETGRPGRAGEPAGAAPHGSVSPSETRSSELSADASKRASRASTEFRARRQTPFPRVEATQRSIRAFVGGPEEPSWVRYDLRPLMVCFAGVAASIPIMIITATITLVALVVTSAPF